MSTTSESPAKAAQNSMILHRSSSYLKRPTLVLKRPAQRRPVAAPRANSAHRLPAASYPSHLRPATGRRKKLALLLPGHNEELILATTIRSAIAAGQSKRDIYVVDDASTDKTRQIAISLLGKANVLTVKRSGKAMAVHKAIKKFRIESEYQWVHIADADSVFSPDYFRIYRRKLTNDYVVALGFVQSLRGNWISTYRAMSYTYGQHVYRRIQNALGMIAVFPGPVTSFRTDIISQLEITGNSLTEDFDITLQVHRKKMGKMLFIPNAINYTQDPQTLRDFAKQSMRWYRGFFQGVRKYRIGFGGQRIDVGLGFQMLQTLIFFFQIAVLLPMVLIMTRDWTVLAVAVAIDVIITGFIAIASSVAAKRWMLLGVLPYYYILRNLEVALYYYAFIEVMVFKRFRDDIVGWATEGRRYKLQADALQDVAAS